jgi:hypothetical protein
MAEYCNMSLGLIHERLMIVTNVDSHTSDINNVLYDTFGNALHVPYSFSKATNLISIGYK